MNYWLVYGKADEMPNSLESMVVCNIFLHAALYITRERLTMGGKKEKYI